VYLRQRSLDEVLPWDFIDVGIPKQALAREYRAMLEPQAQEGAA
jgi:hypothetical protein